MKTAIYPGSFDPITNGHLNIINRASKLFETLYVLVSENPAKNYVFSIKERAELIKKTTLDLKNVIVIEASDLTIIEASKVNADVIIKGIRNNDDIKDEYIQYQFNISHKKDLETLLLFADEELIEVSSSTLKNKILENQNVDKFLPECIRSEVINRVKERLK